MIRWNPGTGRWSDELPSRLCDFVINPGVIGQGATGAGLTLTLDSTQQDASSSSSYNHTPVGTIPANTLAILITAGGDAGNASVVSSCADVKSNTWVVHRSMGAASTTNRPRLGIMSSYITTQLNPGENITAQWSASITGRASVLFTVNIGVASPGDTGAVSNGNSSTPTSTASATTAQAHELAVGALAIGSGTLTVTSEAASYALFQDFTFKTATYRLHVATRELLVTGTQTYAPTMSAAGQWADLVQTFKLL